MSFTTKAPIAQDKSFTPLSDDELETLETLLASLTVDETEEDEEENVKFSLSLDAADGLFAALALSPRPLAIGQWMPLVMGSAQFEDKAQTQLCRNLLIRHQQAVTHVLRQMEMRDYYPCISLYEDEDDGTEYMDVRAWCVGFEMGYLLQQAGWDALLDDMGQAELHLILALKDMDETGAFVAEHRDEIEFRLAQQTLVSNMRTEISRLLQEPADDLAMLLFVLHGLRQHLLSAAKTPPKAKMPVKSPRNRHITH